MKCKVFIVLALLSLVLSSCEFDGGKVYAVRVMVNGKPYSGELSVRDVKLIFVASIGEVERELDLHRRWGCSVNDANGKLISNLVVKKGRSDDEVLVFMPDEFSCKDEIIDRYIEFASGECSIKGQKYFISASLKE